MRIQHFKSIKMFLIIFSALFVACDDAAEEACKEAEQGKIVKDFIFIVLDLFSSQPLTEVNAAV